MGMLRLFLIFIWIPTFLPIAVQADELPSEESKAVQESVSDAEETQELAEESIEDLDPELALSQPEIRELFLGSASLGLGYIEAWQGVSLAATMLHQGGLHSYGSIGFGSYNIVDSKDSKDYGVELKTKSIGFGGRYFFTDFTPVFVQVAVGYVFVDGKIQPLGSDETRDEATDEQISSSFVANGPWVSHQVGWQYAWTPGWFMEFSLLGIAKTWIVSSHYTNNSSQAKTDAKERVETPVSWGMINFKFGKMF